MVTSSSLRLQSRLSGSKARRRVSGVAKRIFSWEVQASPAARRPRKTETRKLSYKDQRELDGLPARIAELETAKQKLENLLGDPDLYGRDADAYDAAAKKLEEVTAAIDAAEVRWLELEAAREALAEAAGA